MQPLIPHLWFDKEAVEAVNFYISIFGNGSKITHKSIIKDTPSGDCDIVNFNLFNQEFMAISAGPYFKFTPAISFMVGCETREEINEYWEKLSENGKVLMPIDKYPFSERYGWVQDKYGLSWQLILTKPEGDDRPKIVPTLLFIGEKYGKAEKAVKFYLSVFKKSKIGNLMHYGKGQEPNKEGTVMFSDFLLENLWFAAMDGGGEHNFAFNEAISFIINCETQEEIDYYWKLLSADPKSEQCGWCKDKFGVSWQVVPTILDELMKGSPDKVKRVTEAFLKMKKFDIKKLKEAAQ